MHYIYRTTNLINGKEYIGRRSTMKKDDSKYLGSGKGLKRAIKKYGKNHFIKKILFYADSFEEVCRYESIIVNDEYVERKDTYNMILGGVGVGMKGYNHTDETKTKMSKSRTGVKSGPMSEETKSKLSELAKGRNHTDETKAKISDSLVGINIGPMSEETKAKISKARIESGCSVGENNPMYGKKHTEETKAKISDSLVGRESPFFGRKHTKETKAKLSASHKNTPYASCLHCNKIMDVANLNRWHNDNCKTKVGEE